MSMKHIADSLEIYETDGEYYGLRSKLGDDARAIRTDELPEIDLICAGFRHFM